MTAVFVEDNSEGEDWSCTHMIDRWQLPHRCFECNSSLITFITFSTSGAACAAGLFLFLFCLTYLQTIERYSITHQGSGFPSARKLRQLGCTLRFSQTKPRHRLLLAQEEKFRIFSVQKTTMLFGPLRQEWQKPEEEFQWPNLTTFFFLGHSLRRFAFRTLTWIQPTYECLKPKKTCHFFQGNSLNDYYFRKKVASFGRCSWDKSQVWGWFLQGMFCPHQKFEIHSCDHPQPQVSWVRNNSIRRGYAPSSDPSLQSCLPSRTNCIMVQCPPPDAQVKRGVLHGSHTATTIQNSKRTEFKQETATL